MARPTYSPSPEFLHALALLVALFHAVLAVTAKTEKSLTADEIAHLTAGVAYNRLGDFRLQPENGNLPQRWAALPATLSTAPLPPSDLVAWDQGNVWNYGHAFLYEQGTSSGILVFSGRSMIALFSAALGLLIFYWSRSLFGWGGGFISLLVYCFSPSFLAHGALMTSDVVMTFFFVAAVGAWWRHLTHLGRGGALLSAVVFGLACVAKFSAILLLPMFASIAGAWLWLQIKPGARGAACWRLARSCLLHAIIATAVIWVFYGLRYEAFAFGADGASFNHSWESLLPGLGRLRPLIDTLREFELLPEAFLYGFTFVVQFAQQRGAFLNGEYSLHGWVSFFPYAFLVKSSIGFLLLLPLAVGVAVRALCRRRSSTGAYGWAATLWAAAPLLALFSVYWLTSLSSNLNIGQRHILPTYPPLFIFVGILGKVAVRGATKWAVAGALLLSSHIVASMWIRPHYLAYFNALAGGPSQGWRHLVDSSLDWGQDLPGLKKWLEAHAAEEHAFLAYFGTADPFYEGIDATLLPTLPDLRGRRPWHGLAPGVYAISATMLQHVYSPVRGDWTLAREQEFQRLKELEPIFLEYQRDPTARAARMREAPAERWELGWKRYEQLRFARLCYYLRVRPPDAMIGYSILIFRLSAGELHDTTAGDLDEWRRAIERAAAQ